MRIALFDLDGTLTRRDTLFPYVLGFCLRHPLRLLQLTVMPWHLARYLFRNKDRGELKQALIIASLSGASRAEIAEWNQRFVSRLLHNGMDAEAVQRVAAHRARGDYLVLMSASPDIYVPAIARALRFNETICTSIRWDGMVLAGELASANRRGEEKLRCLQELRDRNPGSHIIAYGNSDSDVIHLRACDSGHLVNGSTNATREAARAGVAIGWPFEATSTSPQRAS